MFLNIFLLTIVIKNKWCYYSIKDSVKDMKRKNKEEVSKQLTMIILIMIILTMIILMIKILIMITLTMKIPVEQHRELLHMD